jgi:hypothetical protein
MPSTRLTEDLVGAGRISDGDLGGVDAVEAPDVILIRQRHHDRRPRRTYLLRGRDDVVAMLNRGADRGAEARMEHCGRVFEFAVCPDDCSLAVGVNGDRLRC